MRTAYDKNGLLSTGLRQTYCSFSLRLSTFKAHYHQKPTPYPKDHEFEEDDLLAITPNDIVRWMNVKAFGKTEPDENSQLVGSSWSSLGFMKKVSYCDCLVLLCNIVQVSQARTNNTTQSSLVHSVHILLHATNCTLGSK